MACDTQVVQSNLSSSVVGRGMGCQRSLSSRPANPRAVPHEKYKGIRYRPELNRYISEIRPVQPRKRKIWLGTYKTPEEAARAFDAGIFYTKKQIDYNFEDSPSILEPLPENLSEEEVHVQIQKKAKAAAATMQPQHEHLILRKIASKIAHYSLESPIYYGRTHEPPKEIQFAVVLNRSRALCIGGTIRLHHRILSYVNVMYIFPQSSGVT
uniref:AP2/ERF domain-containing protein n=2 Tax=Physcomitrium patens TaxID=3218 RepID=A0A7I4FSW4_PHYPA